jgi:GGDEF domain-containing protein
LPDISKDDLEKRCEKLRKHISELSLFYQDKPLGKVTGSIGVAISPDNGVRRLPGC